MINSTYSKIPLRFHWTLPFKKCTRVEPQVCYNLVDNLINSVTRDIIIIQR